MNSLNIDQILVSILFILSLINLLFGYKYIKGLIGAYGFILGFFLVYSNTYNIISDDTVTFFISVISGLIFFAIFYLLYMASHLIASVGISYYIAGFLAENIAENPSSIPYITIILVIILAIIFLILSSKLKDKMNVIASSVVGSYGLLTAVFIINNNIDIFDVKFSILYRDIVSNINSGIWITLIVIFSLFQYIIFIKWDILKEKIKDKREKINKRREGQSNYVDEAQHKDESLEENKEKNKFIESVKSGFGIASSKVGEVFDNINNKLESKMEENREKRLAQMEASQNQSFVGKVNLDRSITKDNKSRYDMTQMYDAGELQKTLAFNPSEMEAYKSMIRKNENNEGNKTEKSKVTKVVIDDNCLYIEDYIKTFGNWEIDVILGKGSFGCVYRITRTELNRIFESALKVLTVPNKSQISEAKAIFGNNKEKLEEYYKEFINEIANEIDLLYSLKGNTNIVSYEDHHIVKRDNETVWDIMIRMEFLESLENYINSNEISLYQIVKLGIDICTALEVCNKSGIVHRDIKIQNIFLSKNGNFKLGDFGISKKVEGTIDSGTQKGTFMYMAPEIINGENHDFTVDIYSLGIVLYKLLNCNRMPFLPDYPNEVSQDDVKKSISKRISGTEMNYPVSCDKELGNIVLKACYYNPKYRYRNPTDLKKDLTEYLNDLDFYGRSKTVLNVKEIS